MIIQPLKCCKPPFCVVPPVALFMFIPKLRVCLLGASFAYTSSFHCEPLHLFPPSISLTNSLWQRLWAISLSPYQSPPLFLRAEVMPGSRYHLGSQYTTLGLVFDRASTGIDMHSSSIHPSFIRFPSITISSSLNLQELLSSPSRRPTQYPFSASLPLSNRSLRFQCPLPPFSPPFSYLSIWVSSFQPKSIGRDIPLSHLPLSSSSTLSFNDLLTSITHFHLLQHFNWAKNKVASRDRSQYPAMWVCVLFSATVLFGFCLGILRKAQTSDLESVNTRYSSLKSS